MIRFSLPVLVLGFTVTAAAAGVDPALLALVPPNAEVVYGVAVPPVLSNSFGRDAYARMLARNPALDRFAALVGLDLKRDVRELLLVTLPPSGPKLGRFDLILARGNFRVDRFASVARLSGAVVSEDGGVQTIGPLPGTLRHSLMFLDPATAAIGSASVLNEMRARKSTKTAYSGALAEKATAISAGNDIWFVSRGSAVAQFFSNRSWLPGAVANSVRETSGGAKFKSNSADLSAEAATSSAAIGQAAAAALGLAAKNIRNPRTATLKSAQISANGDAVRAALSLSNDDLEHLLFKPSAKISASAGSR